ncbi:MAG: acyl-CoA dehydrogenase family protein [Dehalococcoidia bacterium]
MNLDLTEIQSMLLHSARDFLARECPPRVVREARASVNGYAEELWRSLAGLGWPGLAIEERYGGSGLGIFDLLLLAEECGRVLLPAPLISSALLCAPAIQAAGTETQRERWLPALAAGRAVAAFALTEPSARFDSAGVQARAVREGDGYVLEGVKLFVRDGTIADLLVVVLRTGLAENAITLFLIDATLPGVTRLPLPTIGADRQAEVRLEGVRVPADAVLGPLHGGWPIVEDVLACGTLAECMELAGVARVALERTVDYAKERVQFGRPIGSFQAIQHLCADMAVAADGIRYTTLLAASRCCAGLPAAREIAQAKAYASDAAAKVVRDAHQIHAGIAFIKDHDLHLYFNRAKAGELQYGIAEHHREQIAAALLD